VHPLQSPINARQAGQIPDPAALAHFLEGESIALALETPGQTISENYIVRGNGGEERQAGSKRLDRVLCRDKAREIEIHAHGSVSGSTASGARAAPKPA
jgi:hypothetical protein